MEILSSNQAMESLRSEPSGFDMEPPEFRKVEYPSFLAEVAIIDNDLVFHFFLTEGWSKSLDSNRFWLQVFPAVLDPVAQEYFKATFPRLKATFIEEMKSWWVRCYGFGKSLNPDALSDGFFKALDQALTATMVR